MPGGISAEPHMRGKNILWQQIKNLCLQVINSFPRFSDSRPLCIHLLPHFVLSKMREQISTTWSLFFKRETKFLICGHGKYIVVMCK